jgi:uncharacterized YigZ family protein
MSETYYSVRTPVEVQLKIEGSRFIADVFPAPDEEQAKVHLDLIKKKYFDATHHCFAYVIGAERSIVRHSDDGEPSGTAGVKILSAIQSKNLFDLLLVVTRYFGGTKLGVGGLGRAYYEAALRGIDSAEIISKCRMKIVEIKFSFDETHAVMNVIRVHKIKIVDTRYTTEGSILRVLVPPSQFEKIFSLITESTRARASISFVEGATVIL